ncbi:MAG: hypothetical protein KBD78_08050 [Oligoflexales bacterium]|nr:hypothetical protein [Oligoflexales bacterium]
MKMRQWFFSKMRMSSSLLGEKSFLLLVASLTFNGHLSAAMGSSNKEFLNQLQSCSVKENREAIEFIAFEAVNPQTGKALKKGELITIPFGTSSKQVNGLEYFAELNQAERQLNRKGYSLRDSEFISGCLDKSSEPSRTAVKNSDAHLYDKNWLNEWTSTKSLSFKDGEVEFPPIDEFETGEVDLEIEKKPLQANLSKTWSFTFGDKDAETSIHPYLNLQANNSLATVDLGVRWRGKLFKIIDTELAHIHVSGQTPGQGSLEANVEVFVIEGKQVYSKPIIKSDAIKLNNRYTFPLAKGVKYPFLIGPVPVVAEIGVRGEAGFKWAFELFPLQAGAYATPWVSADVYAQIGGDIGMFGAGIGGRLILLKDGLSLLGDASFAMSESKPEIGLKADVQNKLEALRGELYGFAYLYYPNFKIGPMEKWQAKHVLFEYPGYAFDHTIYHLDHVVTTELPDILK